MEVLDGQTGDEGVEAGDWGAEAGGQPVVQGNLVGGGSLNSKSMCRHC